jgi:Holliday junction resolvase RusA-like endonuclease
MDAAVAAALPAVKRAPDIVVTLNGHPRGKGRPRSRIATGKAGQQFVSVYTDKETRTYEAMLRYAAERAMAVGIPQGTPRAPLDCALRVRVTAVFLPPASWSGKKRREALAGIVRPTGKPDGDNLLKCVGDALNGVVWRDDSLVVEWVIRKFYGERPMLVIETWRHSSLLL